MALTETALKKLTKEEIIKLALTLQVTKLYKFTKLALTLQWFFH